MFPPQAERFITCPFVSGRLMRGTSTSTERFGTFMVTGQQSNLTRSYRRIDELTTEFTSFNDGVAGIPSVRSVSPDGQTYVNRIQGTNAQGVAINNVQFFDRVR